MSNSFTKECHKCGEDSLQVCTSRIIEGNHGECLKCGYGYMTQEYQLTLEELKEAQEMAA